MKLTNRLFQSGILLLLYSLVSCAGGKKQDSGNQASEDLKELADYKGLIGIHKQHNNFADNFAHKNIVILDEVYKVNVKTQSELEEVIDAYLQMKDALVNDDDVAIDKAISLMSSRIKEVNANKLNGEGRNAWEDHFGLYTDNLQEIRHVKGLENKRSYFSHISEIMYCTIKSFGLKQGSLFVMYCPMVFDVKGAYWISDTKDTQNPYMGSKKGSCGEIREVL